MKHINENVARRSVRCASAWSKVLCASLLIGATTHVALGQNSKNDTTSRETLRAVVVSDSRANNKTPLTTTTIDKQTLSNSRGSVALPFMLETLPSVVASGENGTIGATAIRIRGVDGSRINVNINGITLNEAESQEVFWYNIPNLGGMAQSVQVQRGVGASTGGSPAFGAAINMQTLNTHNAAYGEADMGFGSWNTKIFNANAGTGITKNGLSVDAAYSSLTSDGFLRGGFTDQQSFFGNAAWQGKRTLLKALTIIGKQNTGITWNGAYADQLDIDPHYNSAGAYEVDGHTMYYPNESDNYWQQHYQLYLHHLFSDHWGLNAVLDFTHGDGYYEQYKADKKYASYDLAMSGRSDFVIRKQMDNNAYTGSVGLRYISDKLSLSVGETYLYYDGYHFGNVIWCRDTAAHINADSPHLWYENYGDKRDNTLYAKATYDFSRRLNGYADLQLRTVNYCVQGYADDRFDMDFNEDYLFFNPKAGINYRLNDSQRTYFVAGISNREPRRNDIKDAIGRGDTIRAEQMLDFELGYQIAKSRYNLSINGYAMLYKDQLTPSGDLSSSGYALMVNIDKSYRIGIELMGGVKLCRWLRLDANMTLSSNKAVDYTFSDFADGDTLMQTLTATTDLALSPAIVGAAIATITPLKDLNMQLIGKYVGRQYADNTSRQCYALDPYFLLNLRASYTWHLRGGNEIEFQLQVNNLLNHSYRLNAWASDWYDDWSSPTATYYYHDRAYMQQPGINCMGHIIYRF